MATLSAGQLVQLARGAGWSLQQAPTVAAIALAESGGRTDVVGKRNRNGTRDYGLWQINSVHNPTAKNWADPATNAAMARQVYLTAPGGPSFKPWAAYNNQAYLLYLPRTKAAASQQRGGYVPGGGGGAAPKAKKCPPEWTESRKKPGPGDKKTEKPTPDVTGPAMIQFPAGDQWYRTPQGCYYVWDEDRNIRVYWGNETIEVSDGPEDVDLPDPLDAVGDLLGFLSSGDNWIRIIFVAGGAAAVIAGLVVVTKSQRG